MPSYTDIFGGSTVQPSQVSYASYTLIGNIVLVWPSSFVDSNLVVPRFLDLNPTLANLTVTLPPANSVSVGYDVIINNLGAHVLAINDSTGGLIFNAGAGDLNYLILIDNTTEAGMWRVAPFAGGASAVTQVAAISTNPALTITGSPINASGTFTFALSLLNLWNAQAANTLTGAQLLANTVSGAAIVNNSEPIVKLLSTGHSSFIVGNDADTTYSEIQYAGDGSQLWNIPTQAIQNARPSLQTLTAIWNAQTNNTLTGTKILNNTLSPLAMTFSGAHIPFCVGLIQSDGTILGGYNVQSVVLRDTGQYVIRFNVNATDNNYVTLSTCTSGATRYFPTGHNEGVNQFAIYITDLNGTYQNTLFSFAVYNINGTTV